MAMNAATLKTTLATEIEADVRAALALGGTSYPKLTSYCEALADAISDKVISHIKASAALDNAKFSGTFTGTINTMTNSCSITITNQPVTGGIT